MRHGHHIPKSDRAKMAKRALDIFGESRCLSHACAEVEDLFDVSNPTARNLISFGQYLANRAEHTSAVLHSEEP